MFDVVVIGAGVVGSAVAVRSAHEAFGLRAGKGAGCGVRCKQSQQCDRACGL